jgi:hypothetical protein
LQTSPLLLPLQLQSSRHEILPRGSRVYTGCFARRILTRGVPGNGADTARLIAQCIKEKCPRHCRGYDAKTDATFSIPSRDRCLLYKYPDLLYNSFPFCYHSLKISLPDNLPNTMSATGPHKTDRELLADLKQDESSTYNSDAPQATKEHIAGTRILLHDNPIHH